MSSNPLQQLKRRLEDLVENIFELGFQNFGEVKGDESYILLLCRATGGVEALFQRLARGWDRLDPEFRARICIEWEGYCNERLEDLKRPCNTCSGQSLRGILVPKICTPCSYRIKFNAGEFERYMKDFLVRLEPDVYFPSLGSRIPVDEQVRKPEYAQQEYEKIREEHEKTCKDLEKTKEDLSNAHQEYGKTLQELETVKEELKMAHQELAKTEQELENASEKFKRFTTAFDTAKMWEYAAEGYEELHRIEDCKIERLKPGTDDELSSLKLKSLNFQYKQVDALIKRRDYERAEPIAKEVLDQRKSLLPAKSPHIRASHRKYCDTLRLNKKYETVQPLYVLEWLTQGLQGLEEESQKWKLENGYKLGCVTAKMENYREAENWFRQVLATAIRALPDTLKDAVKSAIEVISLIRRQGEDQDIDKEFARDLEQIWNRRMVGEEDKDILACGHELGIHFHRQQHYSEAERILSVVWEQRKKESALQGAISSADCLAEACECLEKFQEAEVVRTWICENMDPPQLDNPDTFRSRYKLGCVQVELEHYAAAETTLSVSWAVLKTAPEESYTDKLETGCLYGFVLTELENWTEATEVLVTALAETGGQATDNPWMREIRHRASDILHQKAMKMTAEAEKKEDGEEKKEEDGPKEAEGEKNAEPERPQDPGPPAGEAHQPPAPSWSDDTRSITTEVSWVTARTWNTTKSTSHGRNDALKTFFRGGKRWR